MRAWRGRLSSNVELTSMTSTLAFPPARTRSSTWPRTEIFGPPTRSEVCDRLPILALHISPLLFIEYNLIRSLENLTLTVEQSRQIGASLGAAVLEGCRRLQPSVRR